MLNSKILTTKYLDKILGDTITGEPDGITIFSCLTWVEARAQTGYITTALEVLRRHDTAAALKFENGRTYHGSMPFEISRILLLRGGDYLLRVRGQKSERIRTKWTRRLTRYFGNEVILEWIKME